MSPGGILGYKRDGGGGGRIFLGLKFSTVPWYVLCMFHAEHKPRDFKILRQVATEMHSPGKC